MVHRPTLASTHFGYRSIWESAVKVAWKARTWSDSRGRFTRAAASFTNLAKVWRIVWYMLPTIELWLPTKYWFVASNNTHVATQKLLQFGQTWVGLSHLDVNEIGRQIRHHQIRVIYSTTINTKIFTLLVHWSPPTFQFRLQCHLPHQLPD